MQDSKCGRRSNGVYRLIWEIVIFSMLGAVMFASKIVMEALPNIHLLGMFTMTFTLVFRKKALIPIYLFVALNALYTGLSSWGIAYIYIWTILWGVTMLLPNKKMSKRVKAVVYPTVCCLHGLSFGLLYAPAFALVAGLNWSQTLLWIGTGLPFDLMHGIGNFAAGLLVLPLSTLMQKLVAQYQ